jgi:hypothetical protein
MEKIIGEGKRRLNVVFNPYDDGKAKKAFQS